MKLIFDISFFVIVLTIGLNVIFGIIVDTFRQVRRKKKLHKRTHCSYAMPSGELKTTYRRAASSANEKATNSSSVVW